MALAKIMVPSLLVTAERQKHRYGVSVGVDNDDAFWADPVHKASLQSVAGNIPVHVHAFKTPEHHIPFNEILAVATPSRPVTGPAVCAEKSLALTAAASAGSGLARPRVLCNEEELVGGGGRPDARARAPRGAVLGEKDAR